MKYKPFTTTALVCAALLGALTQVCAQDEQKPPPPDQNKGALSPEHYMDHLSRQLNLSPEQKNKVQTVFEEMRKEMQTAFETAKNKADTQLQGILTPEQYQQLQAMLQRPQGPGRGNGEGNQGQGRPGNQGGREQGGGQKKNQP